MSMQKEFSLPAWAQGTNIYEVNIRQYTPEGSFKAFQTHLPRLKKMGVEVLWLMPITPISKKIRQGSLGSYYACSSYTEINPEFGNINDFKALVNAAHELGMKLIIDWVANHTGWDHHWTVEHPDWFMQDAEGNFTEKNGWHDVIDLNFENHAMRTALIAAMQYWVKETKIDGFRCDMAHLVPLDFWKAARRVCDAEKPLLWLAECEVVEYHHVFNISYAWWWMHETDKYYKGESTLVTINNVLHAYSQYPDGAYKLFFTTNHDENSWNGTEYEKYGIAAKAWAVFTCTWPRSIPLIYSGQEAANKKRMKFFDKDLFNWQQDFVLESFYTTLLNLRSSSAAIKTGECFLLPTSNEVVGFFRKKEKEIVLVLLNISTTQKQIISVEHEWLTGDFKSIFSGIHYSTNGKEKFELMPGEFLVCRKG